MSIAATETIVLASASGTRRRMLEAAGIAALVDAAAIDESEIKTAFRRDRRRAGDCAAALAEAKAMRVARRHPGRLVIGADQILEHDGVWLDKPRDVAAARDQLARLRGEAHALVSAAVVVKDGAVLWRGAGQARLVMRRFGEPFLANYVAAMGERLCETVGGYALEDLGVQLFERVEGDWFTILGLPLLPLLSFLRAQGALAA